MARYEINGGKPLSGTVTISGAKNAAVAILPAALLITYLAKEYHLLASITVLFDYITTKL